MKPNTAGRGMATMLITTGIAHFVFPKGLDSIVPPFLPGDPRFWTYLSGLAELVIAGMLLAPLGVKVRGRSLRLWGAYSGLPLQLGLFYWAWAIARELKRR